MNWQSMHLSFYRRIIRSITILTGSQNDNVEDFPNLVILAQSLGVKQIVILESKPDSEYVMQAALSRENF